MKMQNIIERLHMSEENAVVINFNPKTRKQDIIAWSAMLLIPFVYFTLWAHFRPPDNSLLGVAVFIVMLLILLVHTLVFAVFTFRVRRYRFHKWAFRVTKTGIEDNVSGYELGQLAWDDIDRMWSTTEESVRRRNRFVRTPVARTESFLIIHLKEAKEDQASKQRTGVWNSSRRRPEHLRLPETDLEMPISEVLRRLNEFYIKEVRSPA